MDIYIYMYFYLPSSAENKKKNPTILLECENLTSILKHQQAQNIIKTI